MRKNILITGAIVWGVAIAIEFGQKVEKIPFFVDTETGNRALVKSIGKDNSFVPS